ncbi:MAG TPA: DUF4157 domain-containing protein [Candidatus Angelobacter sp.]|nr:DUF4157 domain-containing protein [Candidatus Angelobacter sp.]
MKETVPSVAGPAQKAEPAHSPRTRQLFASQGRCAQLAAAIHDSPLVQALVQLQDDLQSSPVVQGLLGLASEMNSSPPATLQKKSETEAPPRASTAPAQIEESAVRRPNRTGLPDQVKAGVEGLSGMSLDNVRVHYNSAQPAQLNALAYAQGTEVHVAPGQEKHLPHEAWHVVQQAQGRVKPTRQMKSGVPVNDDKSLEHEADVMGAKALQQGRAGSGALVASLALGQAQHEQPREESGRPAQAQATVQRVIIRGEKTGDYFDDSSGVEYAFVTQHPNGKALLFVGRDELKALRDVILKEGEEVSGLSLDKSSAGSVRDTLDSWVKFKSSPRSSEVTKALNEVPFVLVQEDGETEALVETFGEVLMENVKAILLGEDDQWGFLAFKKPGFGERAPIANGSVYLNSDNAASMKKVAALLNIKEEEMGEGKRFSNVKFESLTNVPYQQKLLEAGASAVFAPGQKDHFFYVSVATREARTTSATEGNYVLNKQNYKKTSAIPDDDGVINASYEKLKKTRALQDWAKVDRVGIRGGTQDQAMDGWNALGMAAYGKKILGRNLKLAQDYEWLHIRGVQNGGRNLVENLGAGTWIANSQMIPYENQIRNWADKKPGHIEARYETTTNPADTPLLDKITIKVMATPDHEIGPIKKEDPLKVVFDAQSGLLSDSFTNKVQLSKFRLDAGDLTYQQGVIDAQHNRAAQTNPQHSGGHGHYRAGVQSARASAAAGQSAGEQLGHADYLAGIAAAQAGQAAGNYGHAAGHADYLAGVGAARAGQAAGNYGHAAGHADYLAGVGAAQAGQAAGNHGHAAGHADYLAGVAAAQTGQAAGNVGHATGHADYLAGVAAARATLAAGTGGHATGHADYQTGLLAAQNFALVGASVGEQQAGTDWGLGYNPGSRNAFFFGANNAQVLGYQAGLQRFNLKAAKSRKHAVI